MDLLVFIEKVLFFLLLFAFFTYVMYCKADKGTLITLIVVLIAEFFMLSIESWLWKIENLDLLRFVWFNTFAWCDMAVVYSIVKLHKRDHLPFSFATRSTIYSYLVLAAIQLVAYFDKAVFQTGGISSACELLIPSIAISVMLILVYTLSKSVANTYSEKKEKTHAA